VPEEKKKILTHNNTNATRRQNLIFVLLIRRMANQDDSPQSIRPIVFLPSTSLAIAVRIRPLSAFGAAHLRHVCVFLRSCTAAAPGVEVVVAPLPLSCTRASFPLEASLCATTTVEPCESGTATGSSWINGCGCCKLSTFNGLDASRAIPYRAALKLPQTIWYAGSSVCGSDSSVKMFWSIAAQVCGADGGGTPMLPGSVHE